MKDNIKPEDLHAVNTKSFGDTQAKGEASMKEKRTFQIVVHNPNQVDMNDNILDDKSKVFEEYKDFKSRSDAKEWLLSYVEIIEVI